MNKPTNATEMRELLLDYIDALLLGGIPKAEFDAPKEEPDIEREAAELAELAKKLERLRCTAYRPCTARTGKPRRIAAMRCFGKSRRCSLLPDSWRNATRCCKCWTA